MKILTPLLFILLTTYCCSDDSDNTPTESYETIYIDIISGEVNEYDTTIDNFLGAVNTTQPTNYHLLSELATDSTDFNIFHRYQPLNDYHGNDTLKLRSSRINDTSNEIISIKNVTVVLTIK